MGGIAQSVEARLVRRLYRNADDVFSRPRPDPDRPAGADLLPQIKHIVLLMMENHSFDNYFGTLGHGRGLPLDEDGTPKPVPQADGPVKMVHAEDTSQVEGSPTPAWLSSHVQYADGTNGGFQQAVRELLPDATEEQLLAPMRYWTEADLPFYSALARTFPLADHWFASCLGPTFPNRRFLLAGTADGLVDDLPFGMVGYPEAGTILDLLTHNGIDWANYHAVSKRLALSRSLGRGGVTALRRLSGVLRHAVPSKIGSPTRKLQFTADLYPLGLFAAHGHLRSHERFFEDARQGTLPPVSIVDPDFNDFSEEPPQDVARGEQFAARVINAVMHGPGWRDTLLIWFYDEHGGYYDSVPPPEAVEPDDKAGQSLRGQPRPVRALLRRIVPTKMHATIEGHCDMRYNRLGFRVPAVIVSPYARPGAVISDVFDHTSVLRLIEDKWNLPSLTRRDAAANSPISALDLDAAPAFATPPELPPPSLGLS